MKVVTFGFIENKLSTEKKCVGYTRFEKQRIILWTIFWLLITKMTRYWLGYGRNKSETLLPSLSISHNTQLHKCYIRN